MKGSKACVVEPFISLFAAFNQRCFLREMSLPFAEDKLSSASPEGAAAAGTEEDNNLLPTESL